MIVSRGYVRLLIFLCCLLNLSQGSYLSEEITARLGQRNSYISDEDLDKCYAALYDADANGDRKIDGTEYVTVVQALGPDGFAENATSIEDLSRTLRLSFNLLACLCTINQTDQQCCIGDNAHINNEGTGPEETPDPDQEVYLRSVCLTTINAIDRTIGTSSPTTVAPSSPALPTSVPSKSPTSLSPTTPAPSTSTPVSLSPTTAQPITLSPTTVQPITSPPTTVQPITSPPTTVPPVTSSPTTVPPVTSSPTRVPPVTSSPTTTKPTTVPPTTLQPASLSPTTMQPISSPPTALPVTAVPISFGPTFIPPISFFPVSTVPTGPPVAPSSTTAPTAPAVPTAPTTASASPSNVVFPVVVEYEVAYRMGNSAGADADLNAAMDVLASQVAAETFPDPRGRRLIAQRRRLTVSVESTTVTGGFPAKACPSNLNSKDTCQTIVHSITLNIVNEDDTTVIQKDFLTQLNVAILEGRLQESLDSVDANSNVFIVTGLAVPPTSSPTEAATGSLSSGQTIGIVIGALAGLGILVGAALLLKRRRDENKEGDDTYFPGAITASQTLSAAQDVEGDLGGDGTLGAGQADYRVKSKASAAALVEGEIADNAVPQDEKGADSSSNAGSSGWSSSVGNSTLNSESIDGMDEVTGSSLAAIGAASALAATSGSKDATGVPVVPEVTREDLDLAIEAGDWAAVGATAALLAAASDSQSVSSRSRTSMSRGGSSISSLDAARAAELDHLVDAGDWEGVVVAAAKFESAEDQSASKSSASQTSRTGGGSSAFSGASTTLSDSPSKTAKRDEIREEVENLVRRVVPEEIDNVDEMMLQFKGREEELVETLRTMQERLVAQKARVQGQKQAKRDARRAANEGGISLPVPPTASAAAAAPATSSGGFTGGISAAAAAGVGVGVAAAAGIAAAVGIGSSQQDDSDHASSASGSSSDASESFFASPTSVPSILGESGSKLDGSPISSGDDDEVDELSSKKRRTALELAIEAGDWEAVGEAAAMMSDASVNSASTGEINRFAAGDGSISEHSQANAERAAELDEMIDRGDWTGVVAAASRFGTTEVSPPARDSPTRGVGDPSTPEGIAAAEKEKRLREEQDALAQADLWMEIAQQSKLEGSTDAAASEAADWAIARSLSALKSAEAKGELEKQDSDEGSADSGKSV